MQRNLGHHFFCQSKLEEIAPAADASFWAAEIGVASGENAVLMLRTFPALRLLMVDPWCGDEEYRKSLPIRGPWPETLKTVDGLHRDQHERYETAVRDTEFASDRRVVVRMPSVEAAAFVADGFLSFCFIDGDHRYQSVLNDMRSWFPKVSPGGIFAGHDIGTRGHIEVGQAVRAWSNETGIPFEVYGRCWWLKKE